MKKYITLLLGTILLFTFPTNSFSSMASDKRIQVRGTSKKELFPNSAKLFLEIRTENENLDTATKENAAVLDKYKSLLKSANIKYDKINSSNYTSYKTFYYQNTTENKGQKEFKTILTVDIDSISLSSLQTLVSILSTEKIYNIKKNKGDSYSFAINSQKKTAKEAYQNANNIFNNLKTKLAQKGINTNSLNLSGFKNEEVNLEKNVSKKIDKNIVSHSIEVSTKDMKNLGKIVDLANVLNIRTSGRIEYDIDGKQAIEDELYKKAYEEALKKASVILNKTELNLRKPVNITDNSTGTIQPYYSSYSSKYYYDDYYQGEENNTSYTEILKKSNSTLLKEASENTTSINPERVSFSKTVYIEFEMQ